jgi:glycerol kinase
MLDVCVGPERPAFETRGAAGTIPLVAWRLGGALTWCGEAVMLTAGTAVEWLRDDLELIASSAESDEVAASVDDSGGVVFVPAFLGLGTPSWDFGARGTLLGLTRGATRAHVVRAVLEGVAHRGADLLESAEADTDMQVERLRVDGGMAANRVFTQALADLIGRPVEIAPVTEATTLGAAFLAGMATGVWKDTAETAALFRPSRIVEPAMADGVRERVRTEWQEALRRSAGWVPELSSLEF